ncbi:ATP-binding protein [Zhihengliuella salsuginis]|uniref:histidine kinase n=1 Tax=Zhihengliuella salsuginis TaxID=578222 RepID=A0ABQ3GB62_9MICC|nr:ATP-binding protein [Zhihengliuella salsuginis]GHD00367.1 histidine kinase [Zhihengliuella salsuginis]
MPNAESPRPRRRLRLRLAGLQVAIVLGLVVVVAAVVMAFEDRRIQEAAYERARTVALEVADEPHVIDALNTDDDVGTIAPLARLARETSGVDYVVVVGLDDIRVSHPDPERIGEPVSTDHSLIREGQSFRGVERGTIGVTLRVKEPIYDGEEIVGTISVGILQSAVRADLASVVLGFAPWILGAAGAGTLVSLAAARSIRRRIFGVEPDEVAALLQSQNALLYSVRDGVVGIDDAGAITLLNAEAMRLLGLGGDAVGRDAGEVLDPVVGRLDDDGARQVLVGERVLVVSRRTAFDSAGGDAVGYTLTLQDRTVLESTLRELAGQRGLADALRSQTHEFANRLHVLSGYLSVGAHAEAEEYIRRIAGPAEAGAAVVSEPGVAGVLAANAAVAREHGVEFAADPDSRTEAGWTADDDVLTVLSNLLSNAIEAAGDGGRVEAHVVAGEQGVRLRVGDSGPGIAPADVDRVFERGVTTKDETDVPHGIGLALVDRIVARRRGRIDVRRSHLGGAEFALDWPAGADRPTATDQEDPRP